MIGRLVAIGAAMAAAVGTAALAKRRRGEGTEIEEEILDALPDHEEVESAGDDELTDIKGIGGVISGRLSGAGVTSFQQIADWDDDALEAVAAEIKVSPERIRREEWVSQARARIQG